LDCSPGEICSQNCNCTGAENVCGNQILENGEACELGIPGICGNLTCLSNCRCGAPSSARCGDGVVQYFAGEQCEESSFACANNLPCMNCLCIPPSGNPGTGCGNNVRQAGEACDGSDLGICGALGCTVSCTCGLGGGTGGLPSICGDGVYNPISEQCEQDSDCPGIEICNTNNCTCGPPIGPANPKPRPIDPLPVPGEGGSQPQPINETDIINF
jgi:hypothetical protein